jgi:diadenylate cyclase
MKNGLITIFQDFEKIDITNYLNEFVQNPLRIVSLVIDLGLVIFLIYKFIKYTRNTRVWQLIKGFALLVIITILTRILRLDILNYILTSIMTYGVIVLIIIFQPELRRGLEQLRN